MSEQLNIILVPHTHWDREWYQTFQQFRIRLVHTVDKLLDILDRDNNFSHFMLDGQTIVLDDYLEVQPEQEERLRRSYDRRARRIGREQPRSGARRDARCVAGLGCAVIGSDVAASIARGIVRATSRRPGAGARHRRA